MIYEIKIKYLKIDMRLKNKMLFNDLLKRILLHIECHTTWL